MTHEQAVAEMKAFYADYIDNFNRRDIDGVPRFFAFPWATVDGAGKAHVIPDAATLFPMWQQIITRLESQGWSHSQVDHLDTLVTGTETGLLVVDFSRVRKDASVIETRRGYYVVHRGDAGWKIVTSWDAPR